MGRRTDLLVALATGVLVIGATLGTAAREDEHMTVLGWSLLVGSSAVLAVRRRFPVAVLCATLLACCLYYPLTGPGSPILVTFVVALFTAAAEGRGAAAIGAAGFAMAITLVGEFAAPRRHLDDIALFLLVGWLVAVIAVGLVVRNRRAYLREAEERVRAAEQGREAEARRRATEERLRIARELHDVLGHNLSLVTVQAGAALHRLDRDGETDQRAALAAIRDSSRQALRELRATLGVLRHVDERAPLAVPGLDALDELLDRARASGLDVRGEVVGEPSPLPPDVDLAAFRIVQEALTNVSRHAGAGHAVVRVRYQEKELCVEVDDDGRGAAPVPGSPRGNGIRGMDERARALGGSLSAGARDGGGFSVRAALPIGAP